jgi:hypothetical protein
MFDIFVDLILIHFRNMKFHRLLSSQQRIYFDKITQQVNEVNTSYNSLIYDVQRFTI